MKMKTLPALGPGALESVALQLARRTYRGLVTDGPQPFYFRARVTGCYTVYCGNGWDHTVEVTTTQDFARGADDWDDVLAAHGGDRDAAYRLAGLLVDWALENWTDPCEGDLG